MPALWAVLVSSCIAVMCGGGTAWGQEEVGVIASVKGETRIGRAEAWMAAQEGMPVYQGDTLRTSVDGYLRVVFQDDGLLTLSPDSQVVIDEKVFNPDDGAFRSLLRLLRGKIRVFVSEYYRRPGAKYEIHTTTAVGGVRGTEFIMTFDPVSLKTEVVGISGKVAVWSIADRLAKDAVVVGAHEVTSVLPGQVPSAPDLMDAEIFQQHLSGFGAGEQAAMENLAVSVGVLSNPSAMQAGADAPSATARGKSGGEGGDDAGDLLGQSPGVIQQMEGGLGIEFEFPDESQ